MSNIIKVFSFLSFRHPDSQIRHSERSLRSRRIYLVILFILIILGFLFFKFKNNQPLISDSVINNIPNIIVENPLSINLLRQKEYPGSDLVIEETLSPGSNFHQYLVSYLSEGLKINALLTVPNGKSPENGWPVIIFNHGYIQPEIYTTTGRYVAYTNFFSSRGYVLLKPDYRGHGQSEGNPEGAYYSNAYLTDVLNALSSIKKYPGVNPNKIGMWGHSMGGNITLRSLLISPDIKAAVIWGGVVGSYEDLMTNWHRRGGENPTPAEQQRRSLRRQQIINELGNDFSSQLWQSIDPTYHLDLITAPVQLHHGGSDQTVPFEFSENLKTKLENANKTVEYYSYPGADHNLSGNAFTPAMSRSVVFFDQYLKN